MDGVPVRLNSIALPNSRLHKKPPKFPIIEEHGRCHVND